MLRYAITDRLSLGTEEPARVACLLQQAARLSADGVDFLQVREKDLPFAQSASLAERTRAAVSANMRVLLNAPWTAVTMAAWPAGVGVHLSSPSLQHLEDRALLRTRGPVSASCHSVEEALRAADIADVLLFAPVFEKRVGDAVVCPGAGLDLLAEVCTAVSPLPVLAMGGVTLHSAAACLAAGAVGIAGIRLFANDEAER